MTPAQDTVTAIGLAPSSKQIRRQELTCERSEILVTKTPIGWRLGSSTTIEGHIRTKMRGTVTLVGMPPRTTTRLHVIGTIIITIEDMMMTDMKPKFAATKVNLIGQMIDHRDLIGMKDEDRTTDKGSMWMTKCTIAGFEMTVRKGTTAQTTVAAGKVPSQLQELLREGSRQPVPCHDTAIRIVATRRWPSRMTVGF